MSFAFFSVRTTYNRDLPAVCSQSHMLYDSQSGRRWDGTALVNALVNRTLCSPECVTKRHKGSKL